MKNPWKFESNEKLSSKISNGSNSPVVLNKFDSFPPPNKSEIDSLSMLPDERPVLKSRRSKGIALKMKAKVQQQLRNVYKQLEDRQAELGGITAQIQSLTQALKERRRTGEDLVNNEQMLQFKEKQLNNLMTIHAELLQSAKKEILNEKSIKHSHDEKIVALKKRITQFNSRAIQRQHLRNTVDALTQQKIRLEEQLRSRKQTEAKRNQIRSEAIRDLLHQLVRRNRREIEQECEKKVKMVRDATVYVKNHSELKPLLTRKGIRPTDYFTFGQLKYVQELNFRVNPEAEKIMRIFYREVNPKIPEIIERLKEPEEFIKLTEELNHLKKINIEKQTQIKKKQDELTRLEEEKAKLKKTIGELKIKTQIK